jgi:hypothetical protein
VLKSGAVSVNKSLAHLKSTVGYDDHQPVIGQWQRDEVRVLSVSAEGGSSECE